MTPIRSALLTVAVLLSSAPALVAPASAAPAASVWTLSLAGGEKQCRLTLRPSVGGRAAPVAMPPGCHRAFPALSRVVSWSQAGDGLHFDDAHGDPLLAFDPDGKGFRATSPQGDALALTSADGRGRAALEAAAPAAVEVAQASAKPAAAAKKPAAGPKPAEVAGRYAVLRDKTRDTGCMVTLDDKSAGPGKSLKARLAPACRDQGIVIFDPVGWEVVGNRLVLTARKGHTTELETQEDGTWMNEVKKGKTLSLKRI
ncbi:AprI/Inh family metalloprotease inhibitor [Lichenibacterium dinghuense]|uniref:AprI/Inh family metalloprotease inhibitor n=1 Tax=Lichenibacterium dinghuense TaxID=2895977 RepID=UPI001F16B3C5|nr:AprI/Inh family metalloprotease inhibitor [Lichenibacterium sp. 6Y81]